MGWAVAVTFVADDVSLWHEWLVFDLRMTFAEPDLTMLTGLDVFFYKNPFWHLRSAACKGRRFLMGLEGHVGLIGRPSDLEFSVLHSSCFPQYACVSLLYNATSVCGVMWTYPALANVANMIWFMGVSNALLPGKWEVCDQASLEVIAAVIAPPFALMAFV